MSPPAAHTPPGRDGRRAVHRDGQDQGTGPAARLLWDAGSFGSIPYFIIRFLRMSARFSLLWEKGMISVPRLLSLLAQSSQTGVILTTEPCTLCYTSGPWHPSTHTYTRGSPEAAEATLQLSAAESPSSQHCPGNQVPVGVSRGIPVTFKREFGGFWSCYPRLTGLLKAFRCLSSWPPSRRAAGLLGLTASCRISSRPQHDKASQLPHVSIGLNPFLRLGTAFYLANRWI